MPRNRHRPLLAGLLLSLVGLSPLAGSLLRVDLAPIAIGAASSVPALSSGDLYRVPHSGVRHD
jgi:hypothetical protein